MANGCIPKPTFWTFYFYKQLQGECVFRDDNAVIVRCGKDAYKGIAWNIGMGEEQDRLHLQIRLALEKTGDVLPLYIRPGFYGIK